MEKVERIEKGNLILEGIPAIPSSIRESIFPYQNTRQAIFKSFHKKNGKEVKGLVITTRFAETYQMHYLKNEMGARKQLTFFGEALSEVKCCPNGESGNVDQLIFSKDVGGNEQYQLYQFDLNTGKFRMLTDGKSRNNIVRWTHKGDRYAYSSNTKNGKDMLIYVSTVVPMGTDIPTPTVLFEKAGTWSAVAWSHDDKRLIVRRSVSATENYLHLFDTTTNELTPINEKPGVKIYYGDADFTPDEKGILLTTDYETEVKQLRIWDIESKQFTKNLTADIPWNVDDINKSPDGTSLIFETNEDGVGVLYVLNLSTFERKKINGLPMGVIPSYDWHPDGENIAITLNSSQTPGDIFMLNIATEKLTRWTESEVGGLNTQTFVVPQLIHYPTFDEVAPGKKREIPAFYYKPSSASNDKKVPVLIYIHGGPESQFQPVFTWRLQYFACELGIAVIAPNVRGSSGYGKTYLTLDDGYLREDSVKDIGALLDWVVQRPELDSSKICVDGGSYGGYMVLASLIHYGDRLKAGMERVGISNFVTFLENTAEYRRDLRRPEYGDERDPKMREFLISISPTTNAHKINKPMLIAQGLNDPRVPAGESEQIVAAVRKNGKTVWYMAAKDEGHGFAKKANIDELTNTEMLFLKLHLLE